MCVCECVDVCVLCSSVQTHKRGAGDRRTRRCGQLSVWLLLAGLRDPRVPAQGGSRVCPLPVWPLTSSSWWPSCRPAFSAREPGLTEWMKLPRALPPSRLSCVMRPSPLSVVCCTEGPGPRTWPPDVTEGRNGLGWREDSVRLRLSRDDSPVQVTRTWWDAAVLDPPVQPPPWPLKRALSDDLTPAQRNMSSWATLLAAVATARCQDLCCPLPKGSQSRRPVSSEC